MCKNTKPRTTTGTGAATEKSENLYENLFNAMVLGVVYQDRDGNIIDANPAAQRILGLTLDQLQNRTSIDPRWQTIHSDGSAFPGETHPAMVALKTGEIISNVVMGVFNPLKEAFVWININAIPEFLPGEKKPFRVFATFEDVTERKEAEEKLRESEEKFRSIVEQVNDGIALTDTQGNIIEWNRAQEKISGLRRKEVLGLPIWEIQFRLASVGLDLNHKEHIVTSFQEFFRTGQAPWANRLFEREIQRPDGNICFTQEVAFSIRKKNGFMAGSVTRDITERLQADKAKDLANIRYTSLFEQTHDAVFILDLEGHHLAVNQRAATMLGYSAEEILHLSFSDLSAQLPESQQVLERLVSGEEVGLYERIFRKKDGSLFPVEVNVELVSDSDGKPLYIQSAVRDITERKRMEERLLENEAIFESFMEHSPVYVFFKDRDIRTLRLSKNYEQMLGMPVSDALGKTMDDLFPSDLAKSMVADDLRILNQGQRVDVVEELNGRIHETTKFPIFKDGVPHMLAGFTMDITDRKLAEEELRKSEERYQTFISQSFEGIYRTEFDHPIDVTLPIETQIDLIYENAYMAECNQALADMYGLPSVDALIGVRLIDAHGGKDNPVNRAVFRKLIENGYKSVNDETMEYRVDGKPIWFLSNTIGTVENGQLVRLWGTALVITDRKRAEEELRQSEASLKFSQQVAHVGNWAWDTVKNRVTWSDEMYRIFGLDPATFDGDIDKIVMQSVYPDDREKVIESNKVVLTEQKPAPMEYRVIWPDRSVHTVWAVPGAKVVDAEEKIIKLSGIVQDITERKRVEQALRESEEKMRSIFRVAPTGIGVVSNRILLDVNERICDLTGYTRDELIGQSARILYPSQDEFDYVGRVKYDQIAQKGTGSVETRWQRKDGSIINVLIASTPIDSTDLSRGVTFTALDITERKQAEDAMRAIADVSRDISATLKLDSVLERIASYARSLLNAVTSAVYLFEPATSMLRAIAAQGVDAEEIKSDPIQPGEGILGNIALQKWGEIVNDTATDLRGVEIKGTEVTPFEHLMGVPVLLKDRLTALIAVWRVGEGQDFKTNELDFLNSLAQQVAVAIENARLFGETQRRLREMEAIAQVGAVLSQTLELESLLEEILEASIHAIPPAERGSILLADEDGNMHIRAVWGYIDPRVRNYRFSPGSGYSMIAFREKRSIVIPDVRANGTFRYDGDISEMLTGGSAIAAPLIVQQRAIGVIAIDTPKQTNAFKQDDLQLLTAIAASAGLAIDNARLFEETRRRLSNLESLHTVSSALRTAQTLEEALPILLTQLMNLLDVEGATLEVLDRGRGEIVTQLAMGAWAPVTGLRTPRNAGISGRVIATGQTYSSSDVAGEGLSVRPDLFAGLNCVACVPVISQHEPIGALWIGRQTRIKEDEIGLLAAIGEMVGNAIHRMILHEQTERQVKRLDSLRTIERTINSSLDLRVTLNILLEQVVSQLDADAAAILMLNPHTFMLEYTASKGLRGVSTLGSLRLGENATSRTVLERSLCSFPDLSESHQELGRPILVANEEVLAYHAAPLIAKGQVKGILEVFHRRPYHPETEWLAFLQSLAEQAAIAIDNSELFNSLQRSNDELTLAYDNTIAGWAHALDLREKETGDHSYRVTEMTLKLAIALGIQDTELVHIRRGALLHDIGKVGIPDSILLKPEELTEQEWEIMRMHPVYARDLLHPINYLQPAIDIPYGHHEKWDGSGYPQGLSGEAIPLAARTFAIVDVWDALLSDRPYRPAWTRGKALEYIRSQSGHYFDPRVVDVFLKVVS